VCVCECGCRRPGGQPLPMLTPRSIRSRRLATVRFPVSAWEFPFRDHLSYTGASLSLCLSVSLSLSLLTISRSSAQFAKRLLVPAKLFNLKDVCGQAQCNCIEICIDSEESTISRSPSTDCIGYHITFAFAHSLLPVHAEVCPHLAVRYDQFLCDLTTFLFAQFLRLVCSASEVFFNVNALCKFKCIHCLSVIDKLTMN